jgi:hypothetical protein
MLNSDLEQWETAFRNAAKADNLELFRDHLYKLELQDEPEALQHGTIQLVVACFAYASLDGQKLENFLAMQKYNPADVSNARYAFTFDLFGKAYGRVLVNTEVGTIDLPLSKDILVGIRSLWIP